MTPLLNQLHKLKDYYSSGATRSYGFRKYQLNRLKNSIRKYAKEIYAVLYTDLKKSPEESWVTEIGFVISEINHTIKYLEKWMEPEKVKTNMLNFPSKSYIYNEPLGVALIIGPWNYPFQLLLTPLIGAIAAGNCCVLKPSENAPATATLIREMIASTFEEDYVIVVEGDGSVVVPALMENFRFDHVFYTGSTIVGKIIYEMAAKQLIPVTLELGGKSPCVIESDANIEVAARRIALTKFSNAGQMCVAPDYVLVHESIKEKFISALVSTIKKFFSEDAANSYNYGKIINERQFRRLHSYLSQGKLVYGGMYDEQLRYLEPTILEDVPLDSAIMSEEIFGPILPVLSFNSFEEAKAIIYRNPDPLAFYLFTESNEKEKLWIENIHFGGACINNAAWHLTNFYLPFGGRGNSGIGRYHGKFSFDLFSHRKAVMKTPTWFDPKIKYPPFNDKLKLFKKIIR